MKTSKNESVEEFAKTLISLRAEVMERAQAAAEVARMAEDNFKLLNELCSKIDAIQVKMLIDATVNEK
jgi:predicted outer membrane protein